MKKLIILDRDGVINKDSDSYIKSPEEWIPIPGSIEAISKLSEAGYLIAIATNQAGIARGYFTKADLNSMHQKMVTLVEECGGKINTIRFCPHHPNDNCLCRKPKPGMPTSILEDFNILPENSWFVGDALTDIQAGKSAGCRTVLVKTGKGAKSLENLKKLTNTLVYDSLLTFCENILTVGK
ncbi:MAG: D-glycero-beta-D-manno-heptose 1,7-bisphosphate 7-phosphatase [Candidatus Endonucleobacter bathymodioli]|uniref:D,D-heptose 1,7-bisphosphate phosphatase n=1 Tax=Candidatus Endonucleibacter bathymodioli TaxID=539814 RepID=A0AA90NJF3_9GAMM|nr:D-glycero-beta-D-manno-heptose 1,7-bisphosphate 7-phosphatase [Candidatus Endonucleobacter bathymodioli]